MDRRELQQLAKLTAQELYRLMKQDEEDYIGADEICRLTGLKKSSLYHRKENGLPVQRSGNKLIAKRSEINNWLINR
jgi:predicted DNA-binding transcriptional regulator AlpA